MLGQLLIYTIIFVLALLIINPTYFTFAYLLTRPLLQPFALEKMTIFGLPLTGVMALQLVGYTLLWSAIRKDFNYKIPNVGALLFLLFAAVLSFANSGNLLESVAGFAKLLTGVMTYVLVYNIVKSEQDAKKILLIIAVATLIPMLVGYYQFLTETGGKALDGSMNRVKGTLGFANAYGIYLALSLNAAVILLLHPRWNMNKYLLGGIIASILISSVISLNRGTWIALTFAVAVSSVFYLRKIKIRWIILAAIMIVGLFSKIIIDRFEQLDEKVAGTYSLNTFDRRLEYWGITLDFVIEHPIVGWGIGTAQTVMLGKFDVADVTHNDYLRLQLEVGALGAGAYLVFLISTGWLVFRRRRYRDLWYINYPMLITIIYFMVISLPQNIFDHLVNFPLFLALVAIYHRLFAYEQAHSAEVPGATDEAMEPMPDFATPKLPILRYRQRR